MSKFTHSSKHNHKELSKNHHLKNTSDDDYDKNSNQLLQNVHNNGNNGNHGNNGKNGNNGNNNGNNGNNGNNNGNNGNNNNPNGSPIISVEDDITVAALFLKKNVTIKTVTFTDVQGVVYTHTFTDLNPFTFTSPNLTWTSLTIDPKNGGVFYYQCGFETVNLPHSLIQYTTSKNASLQEITIINNDDFTNFGSIQTTPVDGLAFNLISNSTSDFAETGITADIMTKKGAMISVITIDPVLDIYQINLDSYKSGDSFKFNVLFEPYIPKVLEVFVQFGNDKMAPTTHLVGTSGADYQIGGLNPNGFSTFEGKGGPDNLISVAGNAQFIIDDISIVSVQGAVNGYNILEWNNSGNLFLNIEEHLYNRIDLDNIDKIDLGKGDASKPTNHLLITARDVLDMTHEIDYINPVSGKLQAAYTLFIDGEKDVVHLEDIIGTSIPSNWTKTNDPLYPGYKDYISVVDGITVHLEVQNGLTVL